MAAGAKEKGKVHAIYYVKYLCKIKIKIEIKRFHHQDSTACNINCFEIMLEFLKLWFGYTNYYAVGDDLV